MLRQLVRLSLACLVAALLAGPAFAQEHGTPRSPVEYGYHNGYLDGFQHGREDYRVGVGYSFEGRDYDDAKRGYERYMGSDDQYRDGYRQGFRAGYDDGYHGHSAGFDAFAGGHAYGMEAQYRGDRDDHESARPDEHRSVAFRVGYEDGLIDGGKDRRKNKEFRPAKHEGYEHGDHGYTHEYGAKRDYRHEYREGYLEGYQRGYGDLEGAGYRR